MVSSMFLKQIQDNRWILGNIIGAEKDYVMLLRKMTGLVIFSLSLSIYLSNPYKHPFN